MNIPAYLAAVALAAALQAVAFLWLQPPRINHWFAAGNFVGAWSLYALLAHLDPAHWIAAVLIILAGSLTIELLAAHHRRRELVERVADLEDAERDLRRRLREREHEEERTQPGAGRGA